MSAAEDLFRLLLRDLFIQRRNVLLLACRQRAKFEGWLKFECAAALSHLPGVQDVVLEASYPTGRRSDLSFCLDGQIWYEELKTPNVNWRATGLENRTRPSTKNISSLRSGNLEQSPHLEIGNDGSVTVVPAKLGGVKEIDLVCPVH